MEWLHINAVVSGFTEHLKSLDEVLVISRTPHFLVFLLCCCRAQIFPEATEAIACPFEFGLDTLDALRPLSASRGGGGALVFKGGYHARVWPLKTDPKQGFLVDSERHPKQGFWRFFHRPYPKQGFFEFSKNYTLFKDTCSHSYPYHGYQFSIYLDRTLYSYMS